MLAAILTPAVFCNGVIGQSDRCGGHVPCPQLYEIVHLLVARTEKRTEQQQKTQKKRKKKFANTQPDRKIETRNIRILLQVYDTL